MSEKVSLGGVTNTTLHLESDGSVVVEEKQDTEPVLEYARACRNELDPHSPGGFFRHEAEIPVVLFLDECRKRGVDPFGREAVLVMEAMLVDPQYAKFRTTVPLTDPHVIVKGAR